MKSSNCLATSLMTFRFPIALDFIFSSFNYLPDTHIFYSELILMWQRFIFLVGAVSHFPFHLMHSLTP